MAAELPDRRNGLTSLSIVILTWNSVRYCVTCLTSLLAAGWLPPRAQVIVVDNGSSDGAADVVSQQFRGVTVIRNTRNRGVAAGRNQGLRSSSGDAVLLLDVDTVVFPGAIDAMLSALQAPGVGIVGPKLVNDRGSLQYTARLFPTLLGKLGRRVSLRALRRFSAAEELRDWDHGSRRDVDYVIGACQLVRREVLNSVGLLDERIFYGPEDVDFCLRARGYGWRVLYEPRAVVQHAERRITAGSHLNGLALKHDLGLVYFFLKHRYLFSRRRIYHRISNASLGTSNLPPA